jgi:protein MpaA
VIAGLSVDGRLLRAARVKAGDAPLFVFGAIHGDEPGSAELCERLLLRQIAAPLVVAPMVNPDGLARGTKDNARGVDLNRNFAARN